MSLRGPVNKPYHEVRKGQFRLDGWDGLDGISFVFFNFVLNVARYLTMSLRGPVIKPYDEARRAEFDGMRWGWMGWYIKSVFKFSLYFVGI